MIEPIVVQERDDGKYEIVAGHRRFLASQYAGFDEVPCIVRKLSEEDLLTQRIHENLVRRDVDPVEEGEFYLEIQEKAGYTVEQIAQIAHRSKPYVEQRLQATRWPDELKEKVQAKLLSFSAAREIVSIENPQAQRTVLEYAVRDGATVGTVKAWKQQFRYDAPDEVIVTQDGGPPRLPTDLGPPPEGKIMCDVCGRLKPASTVTFVRVCGDCEEVHQSEPVEGA